MIASFQKEGSPPAHNPQSISDVANGWMELVLTVNYVPSKYFVLTKITTYQMIEKAQLNIVKLKMV